MFRRAAFIFTAVSVLGLAMAPAARATTDDAAKIPPPVAPAKMKEMAKINPYYPKLDKKEREIGEKLNKQELSHLYHIREGFGEIQAVGIAQRDVATAVKACAKANPALQDSIEGRFDEWGDKINPIIKEKSAEIDKAINTQTYAKPADIRAYLKLYRQTAEYANKALDKGNINTSPESCKKLVESMDHTQDVVARLLNQITMLPWPPAQEKAPAEDLQQ